MSKKAIVGIPSLEAAEAFADGMLYVNDSAISDVEVTEDAVTPSAWIVRFEDADDWADAEITYVRCNMGA